jgi:enoyl-CoA hydratase/carnithine racemase
VVAKIRGHCFTGGLEVALAADLLIGDQSARFADTHGTWGLTPLWGMSQRLPRRVGLANAKRMMFTSRTLSAEEALSIGLIDLCVAPERLDEEVRLLAGSIVVNSSFSNRAYKRLLRETDGMPLGEGLRYEREKTPGIAPDALERIRSFKKR